MTQIDWSKAPEGATHFGPKHDYLVEKWFMKDEAGWLLWESAGWSSCRGGIQKLREDTLIQRPPQQPWSGEGKPPVGATVEVHRGKWNIRIDSECFLDRPVTVAAVFTMSNGTEMVAVDGGPEIGCEVFRAECVRPIRTPEQIAAEQREIGIDAILNAYTYTVGPCTHRILRSQAERLYDAGIRKMMSDAEEVKS